MKDKKVEHIVFSGGGSGGHSIVAMTLIKGFQQRGVEKISFIGSKDGLERDLCQQNGIQYYPIPTGKLRRYFSWENFTDVIRIIGGIFVSFYYFLFHLFKADVFFSTGGFVSVPPAIVAKLLGKKVYLHEQTSRAGLANRIISVFSDKIFISFMASKIFFPAVKTVFTGYPLREEFRNAEIEHATFEGINLKNPAKPILYATGGGNGAKIINDLIVQNLDRLLDKYLVVHQVGKRFYQEFKAKARTGYVVVPFVGQELPSLMKACDVMVSRAGAGTVCEAMALQKKVIFIPLKIAQKNEQYHNAMEAMNRTKSLIISEDEVRDLDLEVKIKQLENNVEHLEFQDYSDLIYESVLQPDKV